MNKESRQRQELNQNESVSEQINRRHGGSIDAAEERESLPLYVLELDVTDDASVERAVENTHAQPGCIDILVNNVGYSLYGLTEAVTLEQAKRISSNITS